MTETSSPRQSPQQSFRLAYMAYAGITEAQMPTHRRGARIALAVIVIIALAVPLLADWPAIGAGAIAAVIVWGIPAIGGFLLGVLGMIALAVWG